MTSIIELFNKMFMPHKVKPIRREYRMVDELYPYFKYVICVNNKYLSDLDWMFGPKELHEWANEYNCVCMMDRALYNKWNNRWESNGIGGGDYYFLATNDDEVATISMLRWS